MLNTSRKQEQSQTILPAFMPFSSGTSCCFETEPDEMSWDKEGMHHVESYLYCLSLFSRGYGRVRRRKHINFTLNRIIMQIKCIISSLDAKAAAFLLQLLRAFPVSQLVLNYFKECLFKVTSQSVVLQPPDNSHISWGSLVPPCASTAPLCCWEEVLISVCRHQLTR